MKRWNKDKCPSPVPFLSGWLSHNNFSSMVNENWNNENPMEESVKKFMATTKRWNKDLFGHIMKSKRNI